MSQRQRGDDGCDGKVRHATEAAAKKFRARTGRFVQRRMRPYLCACGWWHLTKEQAR